MVIEIYSIKVIYNLIPSLRSPKEMYRENVLVLTIEGNTEWIIYKEVVYRIIEDNNRV